MIERRMGRPAPKISWDWTGNGECDWDNGVIHVPSLEWVEHYHSVDELEDAQRTWKSLILHELAHWYEPGGHHARMYALFFWMCKWARLPMRWVYQDELPYKPRAAKSGYRLYRRQRRAWGARRHRQMAA